MPDVRTTQIDEQGAVDIWFDVETDCGINDDDIGKPCAMSGNKEVSDGADNEALAGKILGVWPNGETTATRALVRVGGVCTGLPYAGTAPEVGYTVQMQAAHVVDKGATAQIARGLCINVDTTAVTCDVIL